MITDDEFGKIHIEYFYEILFSDLGERDEQNRLVPNIKWGAVFDKRCTPIETAFISKNYQGSRSNAKLEKYSDNRKYRKYGTIDINGKPIFYYIYFTIQEILNAIR